MEEQMLKQQLVEEFCQLIKIDSPSGGERAMADCLKKKLQELGFQVEEDSAGEAFGGNAGNIYAYLAGEKDLPPLLFSAHLDTVEPSSGKEAVLETDGRIASAGRAVLGADCVAGLVEILGGVRQVLASGLPHRPIEILLPVAEETYCQGCSRFDFSRLQAKESYVLDLTGPVGSAANQAPSLVSFQLTITGKAAHSGMEPEKGVNAIQLMGKVLQAIPQGHVDAETTCNIGLIEGGKMINIVPDLCTIKGEVRGFNHATVIEQLEKIKQIIDQQLWGTGATADFQHTIHIYSYLTKADAPVARRFGQACKALGLPGELTRTFGGSDQNPLSHYGLEGLVLSNGMYKMHTVEEYTTISDLWQGSRLVAQLILGGEPL